MFHFCGECLSLSNHNLALRTSLDYFSGREHAFRLKSVKVSDYKTPVMLFREIHFSTDSLHALSFVLNKGEYHLESCALTPVMEFFECAIQSIKLVVFHDFIL